MQLWIDVEDLFVHAANGARRMSGIQRFEAELCRALRTATVDTALPGIAAVRFLRHEAAWLAFREIEWPELRALLAQLSAEPAEPASLAAAAQAAQHPPAEPARDADVRPSWPRRVARRLPIRVRRPLGAVVRAQQKAWRSVVGVARAAARATLDGARTQPHGAKSGSATALELPANRPRSALAAAPGDVLLTAGAAWIFPRYAARVATLRRRGVRFAVVVHDIIPLRRPEWCDPKHSQVFRNWLDATLPQCDTLLTVSRASAREITFYATGSGLELPHDPVVVPMGGSFGQPPRPVAVDVPHTHAAAASMTEAVGTTELHRLPNSGSYALFVSTLEPRKNQAYLVQVWRQLLEELPRERVPTLVLAGHVGSMVGDLLQELRNSGYLAGKVRLVCDPSDAELAALYRGCRFTLFPSLYEGWGLPVSESLSFGKPCLASNATAIPEAGGRLARYFDPLNVRSGVLAVRALIDHPENLASWQAQVAREHNATPWSQTALAVVAALESSVRPVSQLTPADVCD